MNLDPFDTACAFDDVVEPHLRLKAIAEQLQGMVTAGELEALPADTQRTLGVLPMLLLDISGEVFAERHPTGRVIRLRPALGLIAGGRV